MTLSYDELRRGRPETPDTPRELAKWLIWPYVARGDSIESLRMSHMGYGGPQGDVEIDLDHVLVYRLGPYDHTKTVEENVANHFLIARFSLRDLYREVQAEQRTGITQPALFGNRSEVASA